MKDRARSVSSCPLPPRNVIWIPYLWDPNGASPVWRIPTPIDAPFDRAGAVKAARAWPKGYLYRVVKYVLPPFKLRLAKKRPAKTGRAR